MSQLDTNTNGTDTTKAEVPVLYISPVIFCISVLGYEFYVYNVVYLGRILPTLGKTDYILPFSLAFNYFWALTLWSYFSVRCTDPGSITEQWRNFVTETSGLDVIVSRQEWQPGRVTTNKKSNEFRPERAHFCSTMKKDVLRMDHFCPWTGACVGFANHKPFLLLGFYGANAGMIAFLTSLADLIGCTTGYAEQSYVWANISVSDRCQFIVFGVFAVMVMLLLTGLFTSHFPLACRNMTTIEELYTNMPNPYDQQSWFRNLEQVFGGFGLDWFFPVKPRSLKSDGFSYRRNGEVFPEGLIEVYGDNARQQPQDLENFIHRLPEDIWHFRYTGQTRGAKQQMEAGANSWFAWLSGG